MTDSRVPVATEEVPGPTRQYDYEIQFWTLVWLGVGLLVLVLLSMIGVWFLVRAYERSSVAGDPPKPVLEASPSADAGQGPKLLARPETDLERHRQREAERLEGYLVLDREQGRVSIPVDRALDLALERGLVAGSATGAADAAGAAGAASATEPTPPATPEEAATPRQPATETPAVPAPGPVPATAPAPDAEDEEPAAAEEALAEEPDPETTTAAAGEEPDGR